MADDSNDYDRQTEPVIPKPIAPRPPTFETSSAESRRNAEMVRNVRSYAITSAIVTFLYSAMAPV